LSSEDPEEVIATVRKLGGSRSPEVVEPLIKLLGSKNDKIVWEAAKSLGMVGDRKATEPLKGLLASKFWDIRWVSVEALGKLRDPAALEALAGIAENDAHDYVKSAAQTAISRIKGVKEKGKSASQKPAEKSCKKPGISFSPEMPDAVSLAMGEKAAYPGSLDEGKTAYQCGGAMMEEAEGTGGTYALCCDASSKEAACANENPERLTLVPLAPGSEEIMVFKASKGRQPRPHKVTVTVTDAPPCQ
jgi:hypothetical protein